MAVRFDADGESYTRATGLSTVTTWSFSCWVKLAADRTTTTVLAQIDNGSGSGMFRINAWNGTALTFQTDSGGWFGNIGLTLTVGGWFYVAVSGTSNPGQVRTAARAAGSTMWVGGQSSQANVLFSAATLRIGDGQAANEWLNGSLAAVKIWDQALAVEELQNESWTYAPRRTAGLRGWYPFLSPSTTDFSGLAQTLSGGTGATLDDPPPLTWRAGRRRVVRSGPQLVQGSLAATLPPLTATAAGTVKASGDLAGSLPTLTAAATGSVKTTGTVTAALPRLAASLTGDVEGSALAAVLPALTATLAGQATVAGDLAGALPPLAAQLGGEVEIPTNDITIAASAPRRGWAAGLPDGGWDTGTATRSWTATSTTGSSYATTGASRSWQAGPPTT
ncbi:LamG-like jellyroll fold domain-containing protein [Nonomuraea pusilla]|uniref:LamG-like jellyroll fold domain-containing protein n=1 Tax=Nonomuraea pusilla TaxID=46177 RepID=UPI003334A10B